MSISKARACLGGLEGVQRRFERWRGTRKLPSRIPEPLWAAAVRVAGTYGRSPYCQGAAGGLLLTQRAGGQQGAAARGGSEKELPSPTFLELAPPAEQGSAAVPVGPCECTLELEDADGAKMRVHLKGVATPDLAALSRSFWDPAS